MNFFFGINEKNIKSKISIPKFQCTGLQDNKIKLFSATIKNSRWEVIKEFSEESNNFFTINSDKIDNEKIFFLAHENEVKNYLIENEGKILKDINKFTNTAPSYRCNLRIFADNLGYSSYQSDYPFKMINKNGNILSSLYLLTNKKADKNYILLRNIFHEPIIENFILYIVDINQKKVLLQKKVRSNYSNLIEIDEEFISESSYIFTNKYLGIPVYISILNGNISFEHTHPPHTYILSNEKYKLVSKIKREINEIIG